MLRRGLLVIAVMAGLVVAGVSPAQAAVTFELVGTTATVTGDAGVNFFTIGKSAGNLTVNGSLDWNSSLAGDQTLADAAGSTVIINAGDNVDRVDLGAPGTTFASSLTFHGEGGTDFLFVYPGDGTANTVTITGNSVSGPNAAHVDWDATTDQVSLSTGDSADVVTVTASATSPQVLIQAEGGDDTLKLADGTGLGVGGKFRGGPGTDTVDYSAYTSPVTVDLGKSARFRASLSKTGTVPDSGSAATGGGFVEIADLAAGAFDYELDASGINSANITSAHLHNAAGDTLFDIGAGASWTDPDSTDPSTHAEAVTDPDINEPALRAGTAYFDIHTTAHATGEIRGQLTLDANDGYGGTATGTAGVLTVENLIGGSGNDTFKGSIPVNHFDCGAGQDSVTTGPGDTVAGCETVNGVTTVPPTVPPPAPKPVGTVSDLKPKVKAKGNKLTIDTGATATCPATATSACTVAASASAKIGKKTTKLGKLSASVATGKTLTVVLKVPKKGAAAWREAGKLKVTVTITLTVPGGTPVTVTKTVKLKAPAQ